MRLLTLARDLQRRKARERQGLFVAEGIRTVEALLASPLRLRGALVSPTLDATPRGIALHEQLSATGVDLRDVSERDFDSAADTDAPQGVLVIAERPVVPIGSLATDDVAGVRLLVLDGIQDPGNAGTLLRTAAGLGVTGVVALSGTVDLWSAKVVRSAMGAVFTLPSISDTADGLVAFLDARRIVLWGADGGGVPVASAAASAPDRLALALGNEGAGLSPAVRARADRVVAVPSTDRVESFNVAVAGAILLYELRPPALRALA